MANRDARNTTVVERGGSTAAIFIGIAVLIAVVVGAYFLVAQSRNDDARTDAVAQTAHKVGDSAEKAGDSVKDTAR